MRRQGAVKIRIANELYLFKSHLHIIILLPYLEKNTPGHSINNNFKPKLSKIIDIHIGN